MRPLRTSRNSWRVPRITSRVRARNASDDSAYSNEATATTFGGATGPCVANQTILCLNNDRFKVEVDWRTLQGDEGPGMAVELTPGHGLFAGGLTNVEVQITVTDTEIGAEPRKLPVPVAQIVEALEATRCLRTNGEYVDADEIGVLDALRLEVAHGTDVGESHITAEDVVQLR